MYIILILSSVLSSDRTTDNRQRTMDKFFKEENIPLNDSNDRKENGPRISKEEMDEIVAKARRAGDDRLKGYREQSLRIHPWVCARCGREFTHRNLHMLTVHHKDHDHDNNPPDGSNWENLCIYCHDNEHRRYLDHLEGEGIQAVDKKENKVTHKPFAALADLLKKK